MFGVRHLVRKFLEEGESYRDSDNLLIVDLIKLHEGNQLYQMSATELLEAIKLGKYGSFEGITRARRKWQEHYEDLRGKKWHERQAYRGEVSRQMLLWELIDAKKENEAKQ